MVLYSRPEIHYVVVYIALWQGNAELRSERQSPARLASFFPGPAVSCLCVKMYSFEKFPMSIQVEKTMHKFQGWLLRAVQCCVAVRVELIETRTETPGRQAVHPL
jgi:hypothetical protein